MLLNWTLKVKAKVEIKALDPLSDDKTLIRNV